MRRRVALLLLALLPPSPAVRAAAPDAAPVALPPFIVEEATKGPPWRYAESAGYEILSRCDDALTRRVVEAHYRLHQLLNDILPPSLQVRMTVPRALILYDEELQPAASKEVISRMLRDAGTPPIEPTEPTPAGRGFRGFRLPEPARRYTFLPNLRLWDRDSMTIFMIARSDAFEAERLSLTHDYVTFLVRNRLPTLPAWFVAGFLTLHREIKYEGDRLSAPPQEWLSDAFTAALKKEPKTAPPVGPLEDFFAGRLPERNPAFGAIEPISIWQAEAELFVRWGLDENHRERREGFWKFIELSAALGTSEALFQECFGCDYATGSAQLAAYLPTAVTRKMRFKPARIDKLPAFPLVNASDAQIARLKGDWERLEIGYVKKLQPDLASKYLEQARRTLFRAYERDNRDPRLLAVIGLCESDAGDDAAARGYLESAAAIGPIRPRACYELARLRFAEACAHPEASDDRLSVAQASRILTPLFAARAQQPPLPEVYELIADVWLRTAANATRRHLAVLDEGVHLFPRQPQLALHAAELNLRFGFRDEAVALVRVAARGAGDDATRAQVAALQQRLEAK